MSSTQAVTIGRRIGIRVVPVVDSFAWLLISEFVSSVIGFGVMILLARRLGPPGFADFEYALAVSAWWLVLVRGGFDTIVTREAARRPNLIEPLTNVLLGLRSASALVGLVAVVLIASLAGASRGVVVVVAGLMLIPSSLATDVGFRANNQFRLLAVAQVVRVFVLAVGAGWLVVGAGDSVVAVSCVVGAEAASTLILFGSYSVEHGFPRPRFRVRAWQVLAGRGAIAGSSRFGRVTLYAADFMALGLVAGSAMGPYAAARRVVFALLALGLVVPTALAPRIARAWVAGSSEAQSRIAWTCEMLLCAILPATAGLMATADRWMPRLFGEEFREGGPWLALIAARLPFVIVSNVQQASLVACRREAWALRLILGMLGLGALLYPLLAIAQGPWGVGLAALGIELIGAVAGWFALERLAIAPPWHHRAGPALAGCLGLVLTCRAGQGWPLGLVVVVGVLVYGLIWRGVAGRVLP